MFYLTDTFIHEKGFQITPIYMEEKGLVFLTQELQDQLGYEELSDMLNRSESFSEGIEFIVLKTLILKDFKELFKSSTKLGQFHQSLYNSIKFAPTLIVLTEAGLYTVLILSRKPGALEFRRWVTGEVLPSIRKTGAYVVPGASSALSIERFNKYETICQDVLHQLRKVGDFHQEIFNRLEKIELALVRRKESNEACDILGNINSIVKGMTEIYTLSLEQQRSYFTALCQEYQIRLPENVLLASEPVFMDLSEIAQELGLYTLNNKPHATLVGAIIRKLNLDQEKYQKKVHFAKHGHQGVTTKYSIKVVPFVYQWLKDIEFPEILPPLPSGKNNRFCKFQVKYKNVQREEKI